MNHREKIAAKHISEIMYKGRKARNMTQIDTAAALGISQSAYSKMENGILIPSAVQWFEFCDLMGINNEVFYTAYRKQIKKRPPPNRPTERQTHSRS